MGQGRPARSAGPARRGAAAGVPLYRRRETAHRRHDAGTSREDVHGPVLPDGASRRRGIAARNAGPDVRILHPRQAYDPQAARRLPQEARRGVYPTEVSRRTAAARRSAAAVPARVHPRIGRRRKAVVTIELGSIPTWASFALLVV